MTAALDYLVLCRRSLPLAGLERPFLRLYATAMCEMLVITGLGSPNQRSCGLNPMSSLLPSKKRSNAVDRVRSVPQIA